MTDSHFSNAPIDLATIPTLEQSPDTALMPAFYKTNLLIRVSVTTIILSLLAITQFEFLFAIDDALHMPLLIALTTVTTVGLFSIIFGYFSDRAISYHVRELDITMRSGVFFKKVVTQPYLRLQHIELKRGPIERKVDLATVQVFSAGGSLHTFALPGLSLAQANALRQYILDHKDVTYHE